MRISTLIQSSALLLCCVGLHAGEGRWEFGATFGSGQESVGTIIDHGTSPTAPYTVVENKFNGPWIQGGLAVGYEVVRLGKWGLWLQSHYSPGLVHPAFRHTGENYASSLNLVSAEEINGTASYTSLMFGLGLTRVFSFGEIGLQVGSRSHDLSMDGKRQTKNNGVITFDSYSVSHSSRDMVASLSFTLVQDQEGFKSFQKFSVGTGFGSTLPVVNPGPNDWKMRDAYLARARPNQEFRFVLGVRL